MREVKKIMTHLMNVKKRKRYASTEFHAEAPWSRQRTFIDVVFVVAC